MNNMKKQTILMLSVLVTLVAAQGCAGLGWLSEQIVGKKIKALYEIKSRPTLVLVDDPDGVLPSRNLQQVIAVNVQHHLKFVEDLADMYVVPQRALVELREDLGEKYMKQPIDRIGSRLGARQVIYINMRSFATRVGGPLYRPTALAEVKLIETTTGHRLFPAADQRVIDTTTTPPGYLVKMESEYERVDLDGRGTQEVFERRLAEDLGRKIAEVFIDHSKPEPGRDLPG